ncbi:MAG TPA: Hsp20 family protein [Woeseiaceae bacterium]|nr:Hsp20 family protein [Woeseiaceae bacterium]
MTRLNVQKVPRSEDRGLPVFAELEELADQIRIRAFNLFAGRGYTEGHEVDDWLMAQREINWTAAELVERDNDFAVNVALAGFAADDISITATPRELIIKASRKNETRQDKAKDGSKVCWSEFHSNDIYRQIEFPSAVDVSKIEANFEQGMLDIKAPKKIRRTKRQTPKKVKISSK